MVYLSARLRRSNCALFCTNAALWHHQRAPEHPKCACFPVHPWFLLYVLSILVSPQQFCGLFQGCPNLCPIPPLCLRVKKGPTSTCRSSHEEIRLLWMILTGGRLQGHIQRYPGAVIARGDEILRETQPSPSDTKPQLSSVMNNREGNVQETAIKPLKSWAASQ